MECALLSIAGFPWNWSCWTLLGSCIGDGEEVTESLFGYLYFAQVSAPVVIPSSIGAVNSDPPLGAHVPNQNTQ